MAKILVVDDHPKAARYVADAIQVADAKVVTAGSVREAVEAITGESFDVVVTDLQMETRDAGLEVLKAAKEKDVYTQVIVITAVGTPEISVQAMTLGAFDYLEKNAPGTDIFRMIGSKVNLALEYRNAKLRENSLR